MTRAFPVKEGAPFDVIVVGAGPAGCPAAIAAARAGAKTLLIEKTYCLGGMWTNGYMNPLFDHENKRGILAELIADLKARNAWGGFWNESFQFEVMKRLLDEKCRDAGVEVLVDTTFLDADTDGNTVRGVYVHNIEGITHFPASVVIDASGDASVAASAGVPFHIGDGEYDPRSCQAMTLMFLVGGIPEKYRDGFMMYEVCEKAFEKQGLGRHLVFDKPFFIPAPHADYANVQLTHMRFFDPLDAFDRSQAVAEGRKQMMEVFEALKNYDDDFKDLTLISSAPSLGIRESRRIVGEYTVTNEDVTTGARFADGVCTAAFGIDIHGGKREQDCRPTKPYQIPYRALIPKGFEGLLIAGKTISGTHLAMASYRVTGNCAAMGEAAGKAAAYAVKHRVSLRAVPDETVAETPVENAPPSVNPATVLKKQ